MNVLIDALSVTKQKAGVGVYAKNIIDKLVRLESDIHLFLLVQDDDKDLDYSGFARVTMLRMNSRILRKVPIRLAFEQFVLPVLLLRYRIHLIHSLHYSFPLLRFGTRQIVTIHDMTFFKMPEVHLRSKILYFRFFIRAAAARADGLIFVSQSALADCRELLGTPRGRVSVVHHGKNEAFRSEISSDLIVAVRAKYGLPENFLLYIGTIEPRKNLACLVEAFGLIANDHADLRLVIAGKKGWNRELENLSEAAGRLGVFERVIFPGFVDEEDKPALLCASTIFVYPSLYEGFGLPVLEAMACGVPTITSDSSSLPEVAGTGAILVNPARLDELATAIALLLSSAADREDLQAKARAQAAKFSWYRSAAATLEMYLAVGKGQR